MAGEYHIHSPAPDSRLHLAVRLVRDGEPPFIASVSGGKCLSRHGRSQRRCYWVPVFHHRPDPAPGIALWRKRLEIHPCRRPEGALYVLTPP